MGSGEELTNDAKVLRWDGVSSPDGQWLAHTNKDQQLWLLNLKTKENKQIAQSTPGRLRGPEVVAGQQVAGLHGEPRRTSSGRSRSTTWRRARTTALTSDRFNSGSPAWSSDGQWLYFLSDRNLQTTVYGPWGTRQPDPHFDRTVKIYQMALKKGLRSPFEPADELHPETKPEEKPAATQAGRRGQTGRCQGQGSGQEGQGKG